MDQYLTKNCALPSLQRCAYQCAFGGTPWIMIAAVATSSAAASSAAAISATAYPSATSSIVTVKPIGSMVAERLSVKPSLLRPREGAQCPNRCPNRHKMAQMPNRWCPNR